MSATNAISGISLVGLARGRGRTTSARSATVLGFVAVTAATINVVGGFMITDRMLRMFRRKDKPLVVTESLIQAAYLAAAVLFILGLRGLTAPDTARRGMNLAALGMLAGRGRHAAPPRHRQLRVDRRRASWSARAVGAAMAICMPMTAMPQRIALSHAFGALAATLVGVAEYDILTAGGELGRARMGAIGFEVLFGSLTITGSLMAFGKLQELVPGAPITYRGPERDRTSRCSSLTVCAVRLPGRRSRRSATLLLRDGRGSGWRSAC